jgi:hypothetical protein
MRAQRRIRPASRLPRLPAAPMGVTADPVGPRIHRPVAAVRLVDHDPGCRSTRCDCQTVVRSFSSSSARPCGDSASLRFSQTRSEGTRKSWVSPSQRHRTAATVPSRVPRYSPFTSASGGKTKLPSESRLSSPSSAA